MIVGGWRVVIGVNPKSGVETRANQLLSVVMPNYNHAPYLSRAIDAIAKQELPPDEIIVIDDASTDNSLARCSHSANGAIRI